jgi:methylase of polypeptide subunit release factors
VPGTCQDSPLSTFGQALRDAGYDGEAVTSVTAPGGRLRRPQLRPVADRIVLDERPRDALATFLRLFALGEPVAAGDVPEALLAAEDLLRRDGDRVVPRVRIDAIDGLLIASDLDRSAPDVTAPVSPSTKLAAAFTPELPVRLALDVGAGSGTHALRMARWAEHVIATDLNPRALGFTRLNAELNGIGNVETREGSLLEPVEGERFGLIVCNPPYVISPDSSYLYRDADLRGDELSRRLLAELPAALEDGGYATLQGNWTHPLDSTPWAPVEAALRGGGCDAVIARLETWSARDYALGWAAPHAADPGDYEATVQRWRESYAEQGIEAITAGTVVLRRRNGARHWRRAVTMRRMPRGLGAQLPRLFAANDRLAGEDLLDAVLRPVEGLEVERYQRPGEVERCTLEALASPAVRRPVPGELADAVLALDGRPLRDTLADGALLEPMTALVKLGFVTFS